jgi:hypothetical protein
MGDLSVISLPFEVKIMLKSHLIKSVHRVLRKNKVDTYFLPDHSATVLRAKMGTNPHEHSLYI